MFLAIKYDKIKLDNTERSVKMNRRNTDSRDTRALLAENRRLRRENASLKLEIEAAQTRDSSRKHKHDKYLGAFGKAVDTEYLYSKKNYISYIFSVIKNTSVFKVYKKIINVVRRYTFITTSLKVASFIFALLETGAVLILSASALIITVPLSLLLSQLFVFLTFFARKKSLDKCKKYICEKNVTIFFPNSRYAFDKRAYFYGLVKEEAEKRDSYVIIVSPYSFDRIGLGGSKKQYYIYRTDGERILLIRKHYYFALKSQVIFKYAKSLTEIF